MEYHFNSLFKTRILTCDNYIVKEIQAVPEEKPVSRSTPFSRKYVGISKIANSVVNQIDGLVYTVVTKI